MVTAVPLTAPSPPTRPRLGALTPVGGDARTLRGRFQEDPTAWLPAPARPVADGWWLVTLGAGRLATVVRCHVGQPWQDPSGVWRLVVWRPTGPEAVVLPVLRGVLGLTTAAGATTVALDGRYRPPGGRVGAAADARGLRRVAQSTAHRFVTEVAARLQQCSN